MSKFALGRQWALGFEHVKDHGTWQLATVLFVSAQVANASSVHAG